MKPTRTESLMVRLERAGFLMRPAGGVKVMLVRASDGKKFGFVHRWNLEKWLDGQTVRDWRERPLPPVAEALAA